MLKTRSLKAAWDKAVADSAKELAKSYLEGNSSVDVHLDMVVNAWVKSMEKLNPAINKKKFNGESFQELSVEKKLWLKIEPPHMSLAYFAKTVRFAAAVAQKVA